MIPSRRLVAPILGLALALPASAGNPVASEVPAAGAAGSTPVFAPAASRDSGERSGSVGGGAAAANLAPGRRRERFQPSFRVRRQLDALTGELFAASQSPEGRDALFDNSAPAGPQPRGFSERLADKLRESRDRFFGRKPPAPPGKGDGKGPDDGMGGRVRVTVKAATRAERTLACELGVAIDMVYPDRIEGTAHQSAVERLNRRGLRVLKIQALEQFLAENFPPEDSPYHDYSELAAELQALAQTKPELVSVFSIGRTLKGRDILALRLNTTEKGQAPSAKPAVVFMGAHHSREHLSVEVPLLLAKHLAGATDPATRKLLAARDIYIIPMVNPDGAEYDVYNEEFAGEPQGRRNGYRMWRKNLRKNQDGSYGVDLNRNYGYRWNTGGSSDNGRDETYHGPSAFSEPETVAVRDFVNARPNLKILLSYHTFSELILYPWGHKYDPIEDEKGRRVHEVMARKMAEWNGYKPEQSSDLYIASGDTTDWSWGEKRIVSFTFELTPKSMWEGGFYPGAGAIAGTFQKNLQPALYLIEYADDPYRVLETQGQASASR